MMATNFSKCSPSASPHNVSPASPCVRPGGNIFQISSFFASLVALAARALALFLGGFSLLNLLGELRTPGFDANEWWIDLHLLPRYPARIFLVCSAVILLAHGIRPFTAGVLLRLLQLITGTLVLIVTLNIMVFAQLSARGGLYRVFPIPFSAFIAVALLLILLATCYPRPAPFWKTLPFLLACLFIFPLLQMICFGKTDYRRHADAIVVFGARAYADGRPSQALADRTRTACELYREGYAPLLIFSGGPGDGAIHETESMRAYALSLGVPAEAIVLDYDGLNTDHTVDNTALLFRQYQVHSALAVSHFYHLPRVKMTYRRAGLTVFTVPAREPWPLSSIRTLMTREIVALWAYYLRPLVD